MGLSPLAGEAVLVLMLVAFAAIWAMLHIVACALQRARTIAAIRAEMMERVEDAEPGEPALEDAPQLRAAA